MSDLRGYFRAVFDLAPDEKVDSGLLTDDELEQYYAESYEDVDGNELELGVI